MDLGGASALRWNPGDGGLRTKPVSNASSGGAEYRNVGNCSRHEHGSANPWPNHDVLWEKVCGQEISTHNGRYSRNVRLRLFGWVWLGFHDCPGKAVIQISPTYDGPPVVEKDFERAPICDPT